MNKSKLIRNTLIYTLLILGYIYLFEAKFELILNPNASVETSSNVNFVYQQF